MTHRTVTIAYPICRLLNCKALNVTDHVHKTGMLNAFTYYSLGPTHVLFTFNITLTPLARNSKVCEGFIGTVAVNLKRNNENK